MGLLLAADARPADFDEIAIHACDRAAFTPSLCELACLLLPRLCTFFRD